MNLQRPAPWLSSTTKHVVQGLSHITFIVSDLDRMEEILTKVLNARRIYDSGDQIFSLSPERFYDIAGLWIAVMQGQSLPDRSYNHIAFKITDAEYDGCLACIHDLDLDLREDRPRGEGEGRSIYFYDHDNHMFELHTGTLQQRLQRYRQG